jgi:hypothetical protein
MRILPLIGAVCLLPTLAIGQEVMSLTRLMQFYNQSETKEQVVMTVSLMEQGVGLANTFIKNRQQAPLYCPPGNLALTGEQVIDIMQRWVFDKPAAIGKEIAWQIIMINALQDVFPCPRP